MRQLGRVGTPLLLPAEGGGARDVEFFQDVRRPEPFLEHLPGSLLLGAFTLAASDDGPGERLGGEGLAHAAAGVDHRDILLLDQVADDPLSWRELCRQKVANLDRERHLPGWGGDGSLRSALKLLLDAFFPVVRMAANT